MTAFDSHQRRDLVLAGGASNIRGGESHLHLVAVAAHLVVDYIDHVESPPGGSPAFGRFLVDEVMIDIYGEELRSKPSLFHPPDVGVGFDLCGRVVATGPQVKRLVDHRACYVVMGINNDGLVMELLSAGPQRRVIFAGLL